jgi:hypothetical protein
MARHKQVKEWNRPECRRVADEVNKALVDVGKKLGISIAKTGGGSWRGSSFNFKVECALLGENGEVNNQKANDFKMLAKSYGLEPTDLGKEFTTWDNKTFRIEGLNTRRPKFPVSAIRVVNGVDGKGFKFPADQVKTLLARKV